MRNRLLSALAVLILLVCSTAWAATTHYNFILPTVGASQNVWGSILNTVFNTIDTDLWTISGGRSIAVNTQSSGTNITLTNPLSSTQNIATTNTALKLILPAMNATSSLVPGGTITVANTGSNAFSIAANDGTTVVLSALPAGTTAYVTLLSGATANGTFQVSVPMLGANNLSDVASVSTSRTNLGLGTSALVNIGTSGATVPLLNGANTWTTSDDFTGATITVPTQSSSDNTTKAASTAMVQSAIGVSSIIRTVHTQVFTSGGTYTPSTGLIYAEIEVQAGGGGGGGASSGGNAGASGGGGGAYATGTFSAATISTSQSVTIGAGGAAGSAGSSAGNGGTTSVGSLLSVNGGGGGFGATSATTTIGGAGGTTGSGTTNFISGGGDGAVGFAVNGAIAVGGNGGPSYFGGGGGGSIPGAGKAYGAGGGGANASGTSSAGGAGGAGIVIITEYCSQ